VWERRPFQTITVQPSARLPDGPRQSHYVFKATAPGVDALGDDGEHIVKAEAVFTPKSDDKSPDDNLTEDDEEGGLNTTDAKGKGGFRPALLLRSTSIGMPLLVLSGVDFGTSELCDAAFYESPVTCR